MGSTAPESPRSRGAVGLSIELAKGDDLKAGAGGVQTKGTSLLPSLRWVNLTSRGSAFLL